MYVCIYTYMQYGTSLCKMKAKGKSIDLEVSYFM